MPGYNDLFIDAAENIRGEYLQGRIRILSEADLRCFLFAECLSLMRSKGFKTPLKVYAERGVFEKRRKIDLVLGSDEVLVELKAEPDYPGVSKPVVFSTIREAAGVGSVEEDLKKIEEYAKRGKHAHFIMIDEDGRHAKKIPGNWESTIKEGRRRYWLHVHRKPMG